jgi:RNA polymerase sigma-70 factor (ECF subfamily)
MLTVTAVADAQPHVRWAATGRRLSGRGTLTPERVERPEGGAGVSAWAQRTEEIDQGVLAAAAAGDDAAFIDVMRHYDRRLRIVAYHVLGDRQLMDDVMQDVALKVYRSLAGFRGEASLGTWLCRITYRACCDAVARSGRLVPLSPEQMPEPADCDLDPAETVAVHEALAEALAALPPEQRLAVLLVDREGFDYATTADILGVPTGTLASRLSAARASLRRHLRPSLYVEGE